MEYLCPRLEARFRQTGHARPIQFREYDCYADFVSLGKHVPKEKLRDCLDLIQILISEQFVFELCMPEGRLQYLLPADRRVFRRLAECDAIYAQLYALVDSGENGVLRYGKHFYENFYSKRDILLQLLWERAGWRP